MQYQWKGSERTRTEGRSILVGVVSWKLDSLGWLIVHTVELLVSNGGHMALLPILVEEGIRCHFEFTYHLFHTCLLLLTLVLTTSASHIGVICICFRLLFRQFYDVCLIVLDLTH